MGPVALFFLVLAAAAQLLLADQTLDYYSMDKPPRIWINDNVVFENVSLNIVVLQSDLELDIGAGFYCVSSISPCDEFLFAVSIGNRDPDTQQIVWSANRNHHVRENATLEFATNGNLVLRDADGTHVWSSNSSGRSVAGMMITEIGNLVLFDHKKATVWQSFDHPTDTLVLGQSLVEGMRLTSNTSHGPVSSKLAVCSSLGLPARRRRHEKETFGSIQNLLLGFLKSSEQAVMKVQTCDTCLALQTSVVRNLG